MRVLRRGSTAVHITQEPLQEGIEVEIEVDWDRRFDHMQQHSGATDQHCAACSSVSWCTHDLAAQHLVTAIAERDFGHKTTSW